MRALKVEFAARRPLPWWLWAGTILILGALAVQQGRQAWRLQERLHGLRREGATLTQQLERSEQARREAASRLLIEPAYLRDAAQIAQIAGFPLDRLLASLESAQ